MIGLRKFRLVSADACGGGTCDCDESLREFAGKASENAVHGKKKKLTKGTCRIVRTARLIFLFQQIISTCSGVVVA